MHVFILLPLPTTAQLKILCESAMIGNVRFSRISSQVNFPTELHGIVFSNFFFEPTSLYQTLFCFLILSLVCFFCVVQTDMLLLNILLQRSQKSLTPSKIVLNTENAANNISIALSRALNNFPDSPPIISSCCAKLFQLCLTLCDPIDYSPQGSSVHGILRARIPEWVLISFSRRSSQPRD